MSHVVLISMFFSHRRLHVLTHTRAHVPCASGGASGGISVGSSFGLLVDRERRTLCGYRDGKPVKELTVTNLPPAGTPLWWLAAAKPGTPSISCCACVIVLCMCVSGPHDL